MKGELQVSDNNFYSNKMPNIPQQHFNAPLSVKGIKNLNLTQSLSQGLATTSNALQTIKESNQINENDEHNMSIEEESAQLNLTKSTMHSNKHSKLSAASEHPPAAL